MTKSPCDTMIEVLVERLDGTLDASLCAAIDAHLRECAPCGALQHDLQDLARLCREAVVPAALPETTRRRIETLLRGGV